MAAPTEPLGEPDHRLELPRRVRHHIGLAPIEAAHVLEEGALLAPAELAPVHAVTRGALQDRFIDVGDVLRVPHACSARLEEPREHVEDEERARVAEMGRVVWRHAAHVDRDGALVAGTEREGAAPSRVVEP